MYGYPEMTNLFMDKNENFRWHDGQQMPGTSIQVSMLKDLVSLAEPTSAYSFLAYLHESGRIYHFLNAQFDAVPRQEFRNYMEWASWKNKNIVFGQEVTSVEYNDVFRIQARTAQAGAAQAGAAQSGAAQSGTAQSGTAQSGTAQSGTAQASTAQATTMAVTADNIVIGVGVEPCVPPQARIHLGESQFHVSQFLAKAGNLGGMRVGVVGGGQSGAEVFLELLSRRDGDLPRRVVWISRRPNYFPLDDSPFTNDFYMPSYSEYFARLDSATRHAFNARQVLTSDGISASTLRLIYQCIYTRRFIDGYADLVALYPNRGVTGVARASARTWNLELTHNDHAGLRENVELDVVIWATGFRPVPLNFLAPIESRLEREGDEYKIDNSFAVQWDGPVERNIFLQNAARGQRGLADPNLSLNAWRSQQILDRLRGVRTEHQLSSFIDWTTKP
jgi:lysine N6-hydroxylase